MMLVATTCIFHLSSGDNIFHAEQRVNVRVLRMSTAFESPGQLMEYKSADVSVDVNHFTRIMWNRIPQSCCSEITCRKLLYPRLEALAHVLRLLY